MPEVGESSRSREDEPRVMHVVAVAPAAGPTVALPFPEVDPVEEEPDQREFRDIPVDTEQRRVVEIVARVEDQADSESEGYAAEMAEPVRGGVMRTGEDDSEDDDQAADSDPEEGGDTDEEAEEPETAEEARIRQLEEENQVHQDLEDQYREMAYQALDESTELRERHRVDEQRILELEERVQQRDQRIAELQAQLMAMSAEFDLEIADRTDLHDAWLRAARRVDELEREVRERTAQSDLHIFEMTTALGRLRDRVRRYPREEGRSRRWIRRRVVYRIARRERRAAVRRSRQ